MNPVTCLIVEDEPHAMQLLEDHIAKVPFMQLTGKCYDAQEAIQFLGNHKVDLIFLDINMPRLSGLEMAAIIPRDQNIIFTTAYSEYAMESFNYHVIDYLLKPITFNRFMQSLQKLKNLTEKQANNPEGVLLEEQNYFFAKSGKQVHKILYNHIYYLEALKEYIAIYTETEKIVVYKRMKEMVTLLPERFVRIHNSYIVNIQHVKNIIGNELSIAGKLLPISGSYKEIFQQKITQWML